MAVPGVFASDQNIPSNRVGDFASALLRVMPTGSAPLYALTSGMESENAQDTVVTWFEENHISGRVSCPAGVGDAVTTTVPVNDGSSYVAGVIAFVEATGEYLLVTAVAGNNLTVQRGFAGTTAANIPAGGFIQRIGTAFEEGSQRPTAVANLGFPRFNYVQIFRNAWDVTGTAQAVVYHTGRLVAKNKADCGMFHAEDIERSIIWGRKSIQTMNGRPMRTMDGINTQIVTNVTAAGGTTDRKDLDEFLRKIFERNIAGKPNERIAFCGNIALSVINDISFNNSVMNVQPGFTSFGMQVTKWITPYGTISLMTHPLMVESPYWTRDLYVYHPGAIRTRYLRRTIEDNYNRDGTRAGRDADFGVLTTELSVEYRAELTGGKFTGMQAAA